jgi:hypothetical protein
MTKRLLISLPLGLAIVIILSLLGVSEANAVGIGIGSGAAVSGLMDSRKEQRPAWGWAIVNGVALGICATVLISWLRAGR